LVLFFVASVAAAQSWTPQSSGTDASLRGLAVVTDRAAWASGAGGTYLVTIDGGANWKAARVPGAESLDFRDVHAIDARTAWLMAAGPGDKSRVYQTADGGAHWTLQFTNPDADGFLDAMAFWNSRHGLAIGDAVRGRIVLVTTDDGGAHWIRRDGPAALAGEGAFAASGTCLVAQGEREAWFGTSAGRIFHSTDGGASWTEARAPMTGIYSLAFRDAVHGVAVGGSHEKPDDATGNVAMTVDGGRTWTVPKSRPSGFRSAAAFANGAWIAVGTSGSDISTDDGQTWRRFDTAAYNSVALPFAVGPKGAIARLASR
jgi:photosystem II stability/assembly factor-like uncharacterized protein